MTSTLLTLDAVERTSSPYAGLEATFDSVSRLHLARTALGPGWGCWEVGAGGGSVARWLADRVGPTGTVLATDIDTTEMAPRRRPNLRVEQHDIARDPFPDGTFRCIHARLVLGQLPERAEVLRAMGAALEPGGWLVVEDFDLVPSPLPARPSADERLVQRVRSDFTELLRQWRKDQGWAGSLTWRLRELGHVDVGASTHLAEVTGGSAVASIERAHLRRVAEELVTFGVASPGEVDRCLRLLGDPRVRFTMPPMVSAWGRRRP